MTEAGRDKLLISDVSKSSEWHQYMQDQAVAKQLDKQSIDAGQPDTLNSHMMRGCWQQSAVQHGGHPNSIILNTGLVPVPSYHASLDMGAFACVRRTHSENCRRWECPPGDGAPQTATG